MKTLRSAVAGDYLIEAQVDDTATLRPGCRVIVYGGLNSVVVQQTWYHTRPEMNVAYNQLYGEYEARRFVIGNEALSPRRGSRYDFDDLFGDS